MAASDSKNVMAFGLIKLWRPPAANVRLHLTTWPDSIIFLAINHAHNTCIDIAYNNTQIITLPPQNIKLYVFNLCLIHYNCGTLILITRNIHLKQYIAFPLCTLLYPANTEAWVGHMRELSQYNRLMHEIHERVTAFIFNLGAKYWYRNEYIIAKLIDHAYLF